MSWLSSAVTLLGILLTPASTYHFNWLWPLPGVLMLIPLSGALLIILEGTPPSAHLLLSNALMSWVGEVSYSLYLVHWPILVSYRQCFEAEPPLLQLTGLFVAMLHTACLLNQYVERRFLLH